MCTILSFLPHPICLFLVICFELPITRIPYSQKSAVVKMIKTWIHRFVVKISLRWKGIVQLSYRQPRICMLPQVMEQVLFFQHFFFSGECVAFYVANRKRRTFMPLRQTNHILIFLFSGCFMFDVRRQTFRGEIETILMNLNLNQWTNADLLPYVGL